MEFRRRKENNRLETSVLLFIGIKSTIWINVRYFNRQLRKWSSRPKRISPSRPVPNSHLILQDSFSCISSYKIDHVYLAPYWSRLIPHWYLYTRLISYLTLRGDDSSTGSHLFIWGEITYSNWEDRPTFLPLAGRDVISQSFVHIGYVTGSLYLIILPSSFEKLEISPFLLGFIIHFNWFGPFKIKPAIWWN